MKNIILNEIEYELIENFRDGFNYDELINKCTMYFDDFDYIAGDWAYGKLRLKGFYDPKNKFVKSYNDISNFDQYLKNNCAKNCRYFLIKKIK